MKKEPQQQENTAVPDSLLDQVFRALVENGSVVPETADEVRRALEELQLEPDSLPAHLRDSTKALTRLHAPVKASTDKVIPMPVNRYTETVEDLQRAARKGDEISAQVEARMKANRLKTRHERQA